MKDRAAKAIVLDGIERGLIGPGKKKHLLDATSGNTGIAYAMLGAAMGFPVTLVMPSNVSPERKQILAAYGVKIVWTDPADGTDGAICKAREMASNNPETYWYADQYSNDNNWRAHYRTTANEIWQQTEGRVTHFVAGLGTSGTFVGTTRRLKELNPQHPMYFAGAGFAIQRSGRSEAYGDRHGAANLRCAPCRPQNGNRDRSCL